MAAEIDRRELAVKGLARDLVVAVSALRPDVRLDGFTAHYPNEAPQDLHEIAKRTISLVTYQA